MSTQLRIRIPPRTYEEENGMEYVVFNDLCRYIKSDEMCGTCEIDEDACSMCMALNLKKPMKSNVLFNECLQHFDIWFRILIKRKKDST